MSLFYCAECDDLCDADDGCDEASPGSCALICVECMEAREADEAPPPSAEPDATANDGGRDDGKTLQSGDQ